MDAACAEPEQSAAVVAVVVAIDELPHLVGVAVQEPLVVGA